MSTTTSKGLSCAALLALAAPSVPLAAPLNFLGMAPLRLPANCSGSQQDQDAYLELVRTANRRLEDEAKRREQKRSAASKANQPKVEAVAVERSGVSPEQLARLKQLDQARRTASPEQRKVLDAEKRKIAGQIMEARMGISVAEMERVKGQSKEDRERLARSMIADKQAAQAADPSARPQGTMSTEDAGLLLAATTQVKDLSRKLQAPGEKAAQRIGELDADKVGIRMLQDLGDKRQRMGELMGEGTSPEIDRLARETAELESGYCARFGPSCSPSSATTAQISTPPRPTSPASIGRWQIPTRPRPAWSRRPSRAGPSWRRSAATLECCPRCSSTTSAGTSTERDAPPRPRPRSVTASHASPSLPHSRNARCW